MDKSNQQFKPSQIQQPNQGIQNQQINFLQPRNQSILGMNNVPGMNNGTQVQQMNGFPQNNMQINQLPNFYPTNFTPQNQFMPSQNDQELKNCQKQIEMQEKQIALQNDITLQANQTVKNVQMEINDLNTTMESLEQQLQELKQSNRNLEDKQFQEKIQKDNEIAQLIKNIKQSNKEKNNLQQEIKQKQDQYLIQEQLIHTNNQANEIQEKNLQMQQAEIANLERENKTLEQQLSRLSIQQKDQEIIDKFESLKKKLQSLDQEIQQNKEQQKEEEDKKQVLKQNMFYKDQSISMMREQKKKIDKKLKINQEDIEQYKLEISRQENNLKGKTKIIEQQELMLHQSKLELPNDYQKLQQNDQILIKQIQDSSFESKQQEKTNSKIVMNQRKQEQAQQQELNKQTRAKQLQELQQRFRESHGQLEICFLIDCTGSMDPYKKQAELCVEKSMLSVKKQTQRDTLWSLICYQDKAELRQLGVYQQLQFTDQTEQVTNFLQQIKCGGGDDAPEDLDGAIRQMINNLNWKTKFKIAMLICDAPCHGTKFHNFKREQDSYPNDDLTQAVELMIQNDIFFIGIIFTSQTNKMFEEIQNIYRKHSKEEYYYQYDLRNAQPDKIFEQLVGVLTAVSQTATQTNVRNTKVQTKGKVGIEVPTKGTEKPQSPIEALCKLMLQKEQNLNDFVHESFRVFRVEFSDQTFNEKYLEVQTIGVNDFKQIEEGQWSCLRSKAPFAKGAMKQAYLMIKQHQNAAKQKEFYVCKTPLDQKPFRTYQSAVQECLVHLIAQKWMKKFNRDLDNALQKKNIEKRYPQVIYSDLLIFLDVQGNYWIAERFFEGEFVKYNNNYGYVNQDKSDLNKIGNTFSAYSFIKSNFKYLICDIQGVKCCFTDPAICTMKNCKLEPTDLGEEGIAQFQISFNLVKNTCQEILQILDINI